MEAHEKGIEAGLSALDELYGSGDNEHAFIRAIKAYLDASGMVLVPRDPTCDMKSKGADAFFSPEPKSISEENSRAAAAWRRMISSAPNPFHKQEEGK